jgi:hypothetical protein
VQTGGQGGLRDVKLARRSAQAAKPGHLDEAFHLGQEHERPPRLAEYQRD